MPLHHLIDTFNQRFIEENKLDKAPFSFDGQQVSGHFGTLNLSIRTRSTILYAGMTRRH